MIDIRDAISCLLLILNPFNYDNVVSDEWDRMLNKILDDFEYDGYVYNEYWSEKNGEYLIHNNNRYKIDYSAEYFCTLDRVLNLTTNQVTSYSHNGANCQRPRLRTQLRYILTVYKERRAYFNRDLFKGEFGD